VVSAPCATRRQCCIVTRVNIQRKRRTAHPATAQVCLNDYFEPKGRAGAYRRQLRGIEPRISRIPSSVRLDKGRGQRRAPPLNLERDGVGMRAQGNASRCGMKARSRVLGGESLAVKRRHLASARC
jgi:hypothetical protein